jgi:hypothetical protein
LIPPPTGLDLDVWIVSPSRLQLLYPDADEVDIKGENETGRLGSAVAIKKKRGKGKEKAVEDDGTMKKWKKRRAKESVEAGRLESMIGSKDDRLARERVRRSQGIMETRRNLFCPSGIAAGATCRRAKK